MWRSLQFCLSFFKSLFQLLSKSTKVFCFYCMKVSTVLMPMFDHFNSVVSIIKARTGIILGPRANDLLLFILIYLPYCLWNTYKTFLRFCKSSWVPALTGFCFLFFEKIVSWEHWERLERLQNTLKSSFLLFAKLCWFFLSRVLIIHVCKSFGKQWKYQLRGKYTFLQNTSWKKLFISHHVNVRARGILFWEFFETC